MFYNSARELRIHVLDVPSLSSFVLYYRMALLKLRHGH